MPQDVNVPFAVHEASMARQERHIKRLVIALIVTVVLAFATNAFWLYEWTQYDYVAQETETVQVDSRSGNANYIGRDGRVVNGNG